MMDTKGKESGVGSLCFSLGTYNLQQNSHLPCMHARMHSMYKVSRIKSFGCYNLAYVASGHIKFFSAFGTLFNANQIISKLVRAT
jgi:fructose-1,6-bisphosphatase/inositol monophosphatase family enzyme